MPTKKNSKASSKLPEQLSFPLNLGNESSVDRLKAKESEIRSAALLQPQNIVSIGLPSLILPIRYERLEAEAKLRGLPLRPLVKPVRDALTDIEREIRLVRQMAMGRLYVINGVTGSGKTTFLNSLGLFIDNVKVFTVKGMPLDSRGSIENALTLLNRAPDKISIVVLEGREAPGSLRDEELDVLLTTLNVDFRSDAGRRTLFVIPTTSSSVAQAISERAANVGGMTSRDRPFYVFGGPSRNEYVTITNETISALNDSRALLDYGISDSLAKGIAEASISIGQFMESCHQEIMQKQNRLETIAGEVKHKRVHLWMVFCSYEDDLRRNYDIVRALTVGGKQLVQISRILAGDAKEVREWQGREAEFAQIAAYLDLRLLYLPMRTALAIVTAYAPDDILNLLKRKGLIQRETVRVRAQESLANTAVGAFLHQRDFADDPSRRGRLEERQKELFQEVMKIAVGDETILNAMIASTLRDWHKDPETVIATEKEVTENRTLVADIAVVNPTDIFCLEMKWRSSILVDSEAIRETVSRVTDFAKNLPELRHLLS